MPLVAGTRLGSYEVLSPLGAGGMGEVYRARDTRLDRDVAIKILPADVAEDAARLQRFENEARAAAALNHPNILALYDIGCDAGVTYIVTELLEGRTLREVLDAETLAVSRVLDLAAQIADGPQPEYRPPRPQATEHLRHERRPREDPRLRPGEEDRV
jgi:serine/threonine protein kinase